MFDYSVLRGKMAERAISVPELANRLHMTKPSLYARLNGEIAFRDIEIVEICKVLGIPDNEVNRYFFTLKVKEA